MAVTATRLDGQNIGLRLDGGTLTVSVYSLNLTTGAVTSNWLTQVDCNNLRAGALSLFKLVPLAERSTVTFLTRLVGVTAADSSVLTLTAAIVGQVATLVVTVAATPANLLAHLPYTPESLVAWASAGTSGGGGGGGVANVLAAEPLASSGGANPVISLTGTSFPSPGTGTFAAAEVLTVDSTGLLIPANASGPVKTVVGVALAGDTAVSTKLALTFGSVAETRLDAVPAGADIGRDVFLSGSAAGRGSLTPPVGVGQRIYRLGVLLGSTAGPNGGFPVLYQPQFIIDL